MNENISKFPEQRGEKRFQSLHLPPFKMKDSSQSVVSLAMYKLKKSLLREGFEIVEDPQGKITLVVRVTR